MRIPVRYAHLLFGALLSAIMVSVVSVVVLLMNQSPANGFFGLWLKAVITTWPIAFPTVLVVSPLVRRVVARMTAPEREA
ncbi:DUF2798 domain-containing protein [Stutzerimonas tarimensis]|uniref:DUF2798 domain-containing protein n=1 Tax=Stutzerimonas tarimensis TaxID=1507735 RepID=A0ABV7TAE4_9GAMM